MSAASFSCRWRFRRRKTTRGRVRWTFFGGSEQGPDRAFWKSFYRAPGRERPAEYAADFIRRLLHAAYGEPPERLADLRGAGFRILPGSAEAVCKLWRQGPLPSWTKPFLLGAREPIKGVKYLLTFRPFGSLPAAVRKAYLAGQLHLLPFPGSLIFWGCPPYLKLHRRLPLAMQIPLLSVCERHEAPRGLRIAQCGWLHEPHSSLPEPDLEKGKLRNTYRRTSRWGKIARHEDELSVAGREDRLAHVLFGSAPEDVGLYDKPIASQLPNMDVSVRVAPGWSVGWPRSVEASRRGFTRRRTVRLPLLFSADASRQVRRFLAEAPYGVSRSEDRRGPAAGRRAQRVFYGLS